MHFDFATAGRILFGPGVAAQLPSLAANLGQRPFLVVGSHPPTLEFNPAAAMRCSGEPTVEFAGRGAKLARETGCDLVVAVGGGSVLDAGKAIAALAANPEDPFDYLEVVGRAKPLPRPPLPVIAAPTTAGTGSEVTRNAVLASKEHGVKASLRHALMLPRVAVVDPQLMVSLPPALTAATGLDALTQLIEPYVSSRANAMTDTFCREGIPAVARALPRAFRNGEDLEARASMAWASLLGGLALANAGLGVVHGLAAPLGGLFPAPHGAVCAALLPHGCRANVKALRTRAPGHPALDRYAAIARWLTGSASAEAEDVYDPLLALVRDLHISGLATYGIEPHHLDLVASKAAAASSMRANPVSLTPDELHGVLVAAM
jgi:alcohol dehydrogenase class IV